MFTQTITYPRGGDDWARTVLIGGALGLLAAVVALVPVLGLLAIVPTVFVAGYLVRVLRASARGEERPPEFALDDWRDLGRDGLKAALIGIAYGFVPAVVGGGLLLLGAGSLVAGGDSGLATGAGALAVFVGALLAFALGLLAAYVVPAALATYAETGRVGDGFAFGEIRHTLTAGTYAAAWLVGLAVIVTAGVVSTVLNAVPLLGFAVGPFVTFYAAMGAFHAVGRAWGKLHPVDLGEESEPVPGEERPAI